MAWLRTFLLVRPWLALALVLAALAVRVAVPAGMMPGHDGRGPTLVVCDGHMAAATMPGMKMPGPPDDKGGKHDAAPQEAPCAFTGLLAAALDTAAPPVVPPPPTVPAVVLLVALTLVTVPLLRLWPPRRGPPAAFA